MAQPYFTGNTSGAIDYQGMQQAMGFGPQTQPINAQGPLSTQNWVKNDMLPPQYQLQDQLGKLAVQSNTVSQLPIANALQQLILAHQFGENRMQGPQEQLLQQQIQGEQWKNQITNPEAIYQSTQQDLANHAKMFQDNYGVNVGEAASDFRNDYPVTDPTGRQTTVKSGYEPSSGILYVPPKSVLSPLGMPIALPAQQIQMPLGMHMLAKEVGAKQAGFDSFADMQGKYNLQTMAQQAAQLQQQKTIELGKYSAANPYGSTSPDIVSNGAATLPGQPMSPGASMNPVQFAARQAQLQQQTSQAMQRYNGTSQGAAGPIGAPQSSAATGWNASNTNGASGTPDGMRGSAFNNSYASYAPVAQQAWENSMPRPGAVAPQSQFHAGPPPGGGSAFDNPSASYSPMPLPQGAPTTASSIHDFFANGVAPFIGNAGMSMFNGIGNAIQQTPNFFHQLTTGQTDSPYQYSGASGPPPGYVYGAGGL